MFNWSDVVGLAQIVGMIVGLVWAISKIQTTTAVLTQTIGNLDKTITKLEKAIERVEDKLNEHGERIAVLEKI